MQRIRDLNGYSEEITNHYDEREPNKFIFDRLLGLDQSIEVGAGLSVLSPFGIRLIDITGNTFTKPFRFTLSAPEGLGHSFYWEEFNITFYQEILDGVQQAANAEKSWVQFENITTMAQWQKIKKAFLQMSSTNGQNFSYFCQIYIDPEPDQPIEEYFKTWYVNVFAGSVSHPVTDFVISAFPTNNLSSESYPIVNTALSSESIKLNGGSGEFETIFSSSTNSYFSRLRLFSQSAPYAVTNVAAALGMLYRGGFVNAVSTTVTTSSGYHALKGLFPRDVAPNVDNNLIFFNNSPVIENPITTSSYMYKLRFETVSPGFLEFGCSNPSINYSNSLQLVANRTNMNTYIRNIKVRAVEPPPGTSPFNTTFVGNYQLDNIVYGNGTFVATSYRGNGAVSYSTNGETWAASNTLNSDYGESLSFANGYFFLVGSFSSYRSVDGINWTQGPNISWPSSIASSMKRITGVLYGAGKYVMTGRTTTGSIKVFTSYSDDGLNWAPAEIYDPRPSVPSVACYGNSRFIRLNDSTVYISVDGMNWTEHDIFVDGTPGFVRGKITFGNGLFMVVSTYVDDGYFYTSTDGINWTGQIIAPAGSALDNRYVTDISFAEQSNVVAFIRSYGVNDVRIVSSSDLINWDVTLVPVGDFDCNSIISDGRKFVISGYRDNGTLPKGVVLHQYLPINEEQYRRQHYRAILTRENDSIVDVDSTTFYFDVIASSVVNLQVTGPAGMILTPVVS